MKVTSAPGTVRDHHIAFGADLGGTEEGEYFDRHNAEGAALFDLIVGDGDFEVVVGESQIERQRDLALREVENPAYAATVELLDA